MLCYKSVFAKLAENNTKLIRRFWMPTENQEPMECRFTYKKQENLDGWNSLNYDKFGKNTLK